MEITFDEEKRRKTLEERGLDFADAVKVFSGDHFDIVDQRFDYGEERILTLGWLDKIAVAIVWTPRDSGRRIISMRHVRGKELRNRLGAVD